MNKKKEKNPYADLSIKKITAVNKERGRAPRATKIVGGDLRVRSERK